MVGCVIQTLIGTNFKKEEREVTPRISGMSQICLTISPETGKMGFESSIPVVGTCKQARRIYKVRVSVF